MGIWQTIKDRIVENEIRSYTFEEILLRANLKADAITESKALEIPALSSGVNLIANTVAMIPIKLYKQNGNAEVTEITDDRVRLLNDETGDTLDGFQFKRAMVRDYLLNGSGYAYIQKSANKVVSLHYVDSKQVSILKGPDPIFKKYEILVYGQSYFPFEFIKFLRNTKDGMSGSGVIEENSKILNTLYNSMSYENKQSKTGGVKKGFIQSEKHISEAALKELKDGWSRLYGGENNENVIILNDGIKFEEATETAQELQMNERKITNSQEVSKILNIPVGLLEGKYTDDAYVTMIKTAVSYVLEEFVVAINAVLLKESEKKDFYFAFDDKEILKGDILKRYQAYAIGVKNGFLQVDDVRYQENLAGLDLDFVKLGLQDVLYNPKTKEVYTPNTGLSSRIGEENNTEGP